MLVAFIGLYATSWLIMVPTVNADLMYVPEKCLGKADKIYTPKPSGVDLIAPHISYHSKVDMHIDVEKPYESVHNLETKVYQLAPFLAYFKYEFESHGFMCGGAGKAYLWWDGIRIEQEEFKIT